MSISISTLTQTDFLNICRCKRSTMDSWLNTMRPRQKMEFRRNIQIALVHYAKGKPSLSPTEGTLLDRELNSHQIQFRAMSVLKHIERNCRNEYIKIMMREIAKRYPHLSENKAKLKSLAKQKWERFCSKTSY